LATWSFLTNHALVLHCIAANPDVRLREIADQVGITERAAFAIVDQLVEEGYVARSRAGRRNTYEVRRDLPLRHRFERERQVGHLLRALGGEADDERRDYAAAVLEAAQDGILVRDPDGRILDVNRRFCEMTGLDEEALVGRLPPFPYWPPGQDEGLDMVEELRRHGVSERRMAFRRADGAPLPVLITAAPFRTSSGLEGFVETVKELPREGLAGLPAAADEAPLRLTGGSQEALMSV
jgi:PAS domain S-box-containing protein